MTFQNLSYLFQEQSASSHLPKRAVTPEDELVHQDETHNNLNAQVDSSNLSKEMLNQEQQNQTQDQGF